MFRSDQILAVSAERPARFKNYAVLRRQPLLDAAVETYLLQAGGGKAALTFYKRRRSKDDGAFLAAKKERASKYSKKLLSVLEFGFYDGAGCWYDITAHPQFGPLANIFAAAREHSRQVAFSEIIEALRALLSYFHSKGAVGLGLSPAAAVVASLHPLEIALREAPNLEEARPCAVGEDGGAAPSPGPDAVAADYYAMGMTLLEIFLSENPRYAADRGYMTHSIASGALEFPPEMPRHLKLLLEGLLTMDPGLRWGAAEVARWLAGGRSMAAHFRAAAQANRAPARKPSNFTMFNREITPSALYEMLTGLYEGRSEAGEVGLIESIFDGTMKKALAQADNQVRAAARPLEAWLDALGEALYECLDKKEKLNIAYGSLKTLAGPGAAAGQAKKSAPALRKAAASAVETALKNELEKAFSGFIIPSPLRLGYGPARAAAGRAKDSVEALFKLKKESLLISREEYEKIAGVFKLPLEVKNALADGDGSRYAAAALDFFNLRAENLFISLEEARAFIESSAGGSAPRAAALYERLERTAGYYMIAQCVKNGADEVLYEKLAALSASGAFEGPGEACRSLGFYVRAILFRSVRWSAADRRIINALLHFKWNSAHEKIFGEAAAGGAAARFVTGAALAALPALLFYAVYYEKYYLTAFCVLIFAHLCYIAFSPPDYEKVYHANRNRIDDIGELCGAAGVRSGPGAEYSDAGVGELNDRFFHAVKAADCIEIKKLIQHGADVNARDASAATPLIWAADAGNARVIRLLAGYGADVNARDNQGAGALMWAAYRGNAHAIRELLEAGAARDARDAEGHTPLMAACFGAHAEAVRALLEAGCDARALDYGGSGALAYARSSGSEEIVRLLTAHIESGGPPRRKYFGIADILFDTMLDGGVTDTFELVRAAVAVDKKAVSRIIDAIDSGDAAGTRLIKACAAGNYEAARALIEAGAGVNSRDRRGYTALIWAVDRRHDAVADLLIAAGADIDAADSYGYTPLMWAVERDDLTRVRKLLDNRAAIDAADNKGLTALMWAVIRKRFDIARELVERGASPDKLDHRGWSALSYALDKNHAGLVELIAAGCSAAALDNPRPRALVLWAAQNAKTSVLKLAASRGADLNARDSAGRTALIHSVEARDADAVEYLVRAGASVNMRDNSGASALIHSVVNWYYDIARILIAAGADISLKDDSGRTAMDYAMDKNYGTIIEMLVEAGADPDARNYCGATLLTWAASTRNINMVKFLASRGADLNVRDSKGYTALMHAARAGWLELAKLLVEAGADPAARGPKGETARDIAVANKRDRVAAFLAKSD